MKYILILGDGMADYPLPQLNNKTPLMAANKPGMDFLAKTGGMVGLVKTIPDGFSPGSDTANLSVLGYAPAKYYTGRSPLEAVSLGIDMDDDDLAVRCNVVTVSDDQPYPEKTMIDYSAGEISSGEAAELIKAVEAGLGNEKFKFYAGVSYRHCLIVKNGKTGTKMTPPHDITGKKVTDFLPQGVYGEEFDLLMQKSYEILKNHPINIKRKAQGLNPGNSIWLWGEGTKPALDDFEEKFGKKGAMISAVDLLKGIATAANMTVIDVKGATGTINTDYRGKANAAIDALENGHDFVYIHVEAPDESGHHGNVQEKVEAIELIDKFVVKPIWQHFMAQGEDFAMLILPDHPTPISTMTHASDPVPFLMWQNGKILGSAQTYDEKSALEGGIFVDEGPTLISQFLAL